MGQGRPNVTFRERLNGWLSHDAHPAIQFVKYGLAGGCATVTDISVFYLFAWLLIPDLTPDDKFVRFFNLHVQPLAHQTQVFHFIIDKSFSFLLANFVAYILNILFVFKSGKHSKIKEFGLFYLVSGISFAIGTGLGAGIIAMLHTTTTAAFLANMVASLAVNYAARKYFIFHG